MQIEILYEDPHLIIVNKPAGLLTQPDDTGRPSLEESLKALIKERDKKPGNVFLEATHRIDRPVSGIVVFAKRTKALSRVQKGVREKQMIKVYHALVEGVPKIEEATLEHTLIHDDFIARVVSPSTPNGKLAILSYRVIEKWEDRALLEINLHTGRYHQIRAQLGAIGHPIVGDGKYGSRRKGETIALNHSRLTLFHPMTGESLTFVAPPPHREWEALL